MKILAVADVPSDYLWGPGVREGLKGIDLILSCGDLPAAYLEYLVTFSAAPLLYVHGNHDRGPEPEGCECVDGKLVRRMGLRILGLGGSIRYNGESGHQYTQAQMKRRAARQWLALRRGGGVDILLTHSAALGLGDGEDYAHVGFEAFNGILDRWQPAFFIHGHSHLSYSPEYRRLSRYQRTRIINAYERYAFEFDEREGE